MREDIRELTQAIQSLRDEVRDGSDPAGIANDTANAFAVALNCIRNLAEEIEALDRKVDTNHRMKGGWR